MPVPYTIRTKRKRCVYEKRNDPAGSSFLWHQPGAVVVLIPFLRKVKAGQKEREEGVPSHQKKAGTPTMGGVMFLAAFTAVSLLFRKEGAEVVPVLFLTLGFSTDRLSR